MWITARVSDHMQEYQDVAGSIAVPNGVRIDAWFTAEGTIIGDCRPWHQVRFNRSPSKRALMAVAMDPDRLEAHSDIAASLGTCVLTGASDRTFGVRGNRRPNHIDF